MTNLAPQPNDEPRPWERPGAARRDSEPHRGKFLGVLAVVAFGLAILSCVTLVPVLVALPLGIWVWAAARRDLAAMRAGRMDREGELQARRAERNAVSAVAVSAYVLAALGLLLLEWLFRVR